MFAKGSSHVIVYPVGKPARAALSVLSPWALKRPVSRGDRERERLTGSKGVLYIGRNREEVQM